jgi:hypothetical protein
MPVILPRCLRSRQPVKCPRMRRVQHLCGLHRPVSCVNRSNGLPTPDDSFRHRPTSHRFLKETVDLPSFIEPLSADRPSPISIHGLARVSVLRMVVGQWRVSRRHMVGNQQRQEQTDAVDHHMCADLDECRTPEAQRVLKQILDEPGDTSSDASLPHRAGFDASSTARRKFVSSSFRRSTWKNNAFPRAKLARHLRYAVLGSQLASFGSLTVR